MDIHSCVLFTKSNVSSIKCIGYVPSERCLKPMHCSADMTKQTAIPIYFLCVLFGSVHHGYSLQLRLQIVGKEPVLNPTHQFVGLLGQTKGQDLDTNVSHLLYGLEVPNLQCEVRYGPGEQRSPCKSQTGLLP